MQNQINIHDWVRPTYPPADENVFPMAAFEPSLKKLITEVSSKLQLDSSTIGLCILGALATACQSHFDAVFDSSRQPLSLYIMIIMKSGGGKSRALKSSLNAVYEYEKQLLEAYKLELEAYKKSKDDSMPKPENPEIFFDNATLESVFADLIRENPVNKCLASGEAVQFFSGVSIKSQIGDSFFGDLTKVWDDGYAGRKRLKRDEGRELNKTFNARLSIILLGQPNIFNDVFGNKMMEEQGFLARTIISCPTREIRYDKSKRYKGQLEDIQSLREFYRRCTDILNIPLLSERKAITWDDNVHTFFDSKLQEIEDNTMKNCGHIYEKYDAYAHRLAENAIRIATLFAIYAGREKVSLSDMVGAFKIVEYSIFERIRYDNDDASDFMIMSNYLVKVAKERGNNIELSAIASRIPKKIRDKKVAYRDMLLKELEEHNHIKISKNGKTLLHVNHELLEVNPV